MKEINYFKVNGNLWGAYYISPEGESVKIVRREKRQIAKEIERIENQDKSQPFLNNNQGYIYFISDTRGIKIGKTNDYIRRLNECNKLTAFPVEIKLVVKCDCPYMAESLVHDHFTPYQIKKEWYDIEDFLNKDIILNLLSDYNPEVIIDETNPIKKEPYQMYYTPLVVANILNKDVKRVYELFQKDDFPLIQIGRRYLVRKDDFENYMGEI